MSHSEIASWLFTLCLFYYLGSHYFGEFGLDSSRVNVRFDQNVENVHKDSHVFDST